MTTIRSDYNRPTRKRIRRTPAPASPRRRTRHSSYPNRLPNCPSTAMRTRDTVRTIVPGTRARRGSSDTIPIVTAATRIPNTENRVDSPTRIGGSDAPARSCRCHFRGMLRSMTVATVPLPGSGVADARLLLLVDLWHSRPPHWCRKIGMRSSGAWICYFLAGPGLTSIFLGAQHLNPVGQ